MAIVNRKVMSKTLPILLVAVHTVLCIATQLGPKDGSWTWFLVGFLSVPALLPVWLASYLLPQAVCFIVLGGLWWYLVGQLPEFCTDGRISRGFAPVASVFLAVCTVPDFAILLQNLNNAWDVQWACIFTLIIASWIVSLYLLYFAIRGRKAETVPTT
jgi:hypothetical protein